MMRGSLSAPDSYGPDSQDAWCLRRVTLDDVDGLHLLASKPLVYRYLFDGAPPERRAIEEGIARSLADAARMRLGMWILESPRVRHGGCVQLRPEASASSAELTYLLDPAHRGRGLATRMAWTVIAKAFLGGDIVVAGTDCPNTASLAVMRRLGMRFLRDAQYPLGAGVEYVVSCSDPGPTPRPAVLHMC